MLNADKDNLKQELQEKNVALKSSSEENGKLNKQFKRIREIINCEKKDLLEDKDRESDSKNINNKFVDFKQEGSVCNNTMKLNELKFKHEDGEYVEYDDYNFLEAKTEVKIEVGGQT